MTPQTPAITLHVYKTNIGLFLKKPQNYYYSTKFIINGVEISDKDFCHNGYALLKGEEDISSVQRQVAESSKQIGFILKDTSMQSDKIPLRLTNKEVGYSCDGWDYYSNLQSLYKMEYEKVPAYIEDVGYEVLVIGNLHIENYERPQEMKVGMIEKQGFSTKEFTTDLAAIATFSDFERMLTPEFMLHTRPCELSSFQVYKIVRSYIKQNIDYKQAAITSDYDFCFTVEKRVITKPWQYKKEQKNPKTGRYYKQPRYEMATSTEKKVKIFEMTNANDKYKGYTIIEGWKAENLETLYENMKQYLSDLIDVINTPVVECEHCGGTGHVVKYIETNGRKLK